MDTRQQILEAFDVLEGQSATRDELMELCRAPFSGANRRSFGVALGWMVKDGTLHESNGRFRPANAEQKEPHQNGSRNGAMAAATHDSGVRVQLSEFQKGRDARQVTVYQSPDEIDDAVMVQFCIHGQWVKIPFTGNLKICVGPDIPKWSPDQETNYGVSTLRVVLRSGTTREWPINSSAPVTICGES